MSAVSFFPPPFLSCQQNNIENVIEAAKAICSVLCFVETRDISEAVRKLRALVNAQVKDACSCPIFLFKTETRMGITNFLINRVHFTVLPHVFPLMSVG